MKFYTTDLRFGDHTLGEISNKLQQKVDDQYNKILDSAREVGIEIIQTRNIAELMQLCKSMNPDYFNPELYTYIDWTSVPAYKSVQWDKKQWVKWWKSQMVDKL